MSDAVRYYSAALLSQPVVGCSNIITTMADTSFIAPQMENVPSSSAEADVAEALNSMAVETPPRGSVLTSPTGPQETLESPTFHQRYPSECRTSGGDFESMRWLLDTPPHVNRNGTAPTATDTHHSDAALHEMGTTSFKIETLENPMLGSTSTIHHPNVLGDQVSVGSARDEQHHRHISTSSYPIGFTAFSQTDERLSGTTPALHYDNSAAASANPAFKHGEHVMFGAIDNPTIGSTDHRLSANQNITLQQQDVLAAASTATAYVENAARAQRHNSYVPYPTNARAKLPQWNGVQQLQQQSSYTSANGHQYTTEYAIQSAPMQATDANGAYAVVDMYRGKRTIVSTNMPYTGSQQVSTPSATLMAANGQKAINRIAAALPLVTSCNHAPLPRPVSYSTGLVNAPTLNGPRYELRSVSEPRALDTHTAASGSLSHATHVNPAVVSSA